MKKATELKVSLYYQLGPGSALAPDCHGVTKLARSYLALYFGCHSPEEIPLEQAESL